MKTLLRSPSRPSFDCLCALSNRCKRLMTRNISQHQFRKSSKLPTRANLTASGKLFYHALKCWTEMTATIATMSPKHVGNCSMLTPRFDGDCRCTSRETKEWTFTKPWSIEVHITPPPGGKFQWLQRRPDPARRLQTQLTKGKDLK